MGLLFGESDAGCDYAGHDWADAGGGMLICVNCQAEKWAVSVPRFIGPMAQIVSTYTDGTRVLEAVVPAGRAKAEIRRVEAFRDDQDEAPVVTAEPAHAKDRS